MSSERSIGQVVLNARPSRPKWRRRTLFVAGTLTLLVVGITSYMFGLELADWRSQECAGSFAGRPRCWAPLLWFYSGAAEILIAFGVPIFVAIKRRILGWKLWAGLIAVTLGTTLAGQLWLEQAHKADALGTWYTVLCAVLYAVPLVSCAALVALVWTTLRNAAA